MNILGSYPPVLVDTAIKTLINSDVCSIRYEDLSNVPEHNHIEFTFKKTLNNDRVDIAQRTIFEKKMINGELVAEFGFNSFGEHVFETNVLYSGQMRFVNLTAPNTIEDPSEWSSVFVFKFIEGIETIEVISNLIGLSPTYQGNATMKDADEIIEKYRFSIIDKSGNTIDDSGWLLRRFGERDTYQASTLLVNGDYYTVNYEIETKNGYTASKQKKFRAVEMTGGGLAGASIEVSSNPEEGTIDLVISGIEKHYDIIVSRASAENNYTKWEDIGEFITYDNKEYKFTDFTPESGVEYKYGIQRKMSAQGVRSSRVKSTPISVHLAYAYLWDGRAQLKLKYNNKVSSFKHNVLAQKQDTIGGKYPKIFRNGMVEYREFPITGLITLHLDENQHFFQFVDKKGYYYKDELVIPIDNLELVDEVHKIPLGFNTNLTPENFYAERKFREKVEEFLYSDTPKLYRSPSEGNIVVSIMNISLTPNQQLGRMISEFSSTAYEIADSSLKSLSELELINRELPKDELIWREELGSDGVWRSLVITDDNYDFIDEDLESFTIHQVSPAPCIKINGIKIEANCYPDITYSTIPDDIQGNGIIYYSAIVKGEVFAAANTTITPEDCEVQQFIGQIKSKSLDAENNIIVADLIEKGYRTELGYSIVRVIIETFGDAIFTINGQNIVVSDKYIIDGLNTNLSTLTVLDDYKPFVSNIYYEAIGYYKEVQS